MPTRSCIDVRKAIFERHGEALAQSLASLEEGDTPQATPLQWLEMAIGIDNRDAVQQLLARFSLDPNDQKHVTQYASAQLNDRVDDQDPEGVAFWGPYAAPVAWPLLSEAVGSGSTDVVAQLLPFVINPDGDDSKAFRWACGEGHLEMAKLLLPLSNPQAKKSEAFCLAAQNGHLATIKWLFPLFDPKAYDSRALIYAAGAGQSEMVALLLPYSDPHAQEHKALRAACENGHIDVVNLLLPVCQPKHIYIATFRTCVEKGHLEIADRIAPFMDAQKTWNALLKDAQGSDEGWMAVDQFSAFVDLDRLQQTFNLDDLPTYPLPRLRRRLLQAHLDDQLPTAPLPPRSRL